MITKVLHFSVQIITHKNISVETEDSAIEEDWSAIVKAPLKDPYLDVKFRAEVDQDLEAGALYTDQHTRLYKAISVNTIEYVGNQILRTVQEFQMVRGELFLINKAFKEGL